MINMLLHSRHLPLWLILILLVPLVEGAQPVGSSDPPEKIPDLEALPFHETPSGLRYAVLALGDDLFTPGQGQTAVVDYTGWMMNGEKFDSSFEHGQPLRFPVGHGKVIKGWDEGIALMGKGAHYIFVIPPELAYGKRGKSGGDTPIPPNATLVFDIRLLDIE